MAHFCSTLLQVRAGQLHARSFHGADTLRTAGRRSVRRTSVHLFQGPPGRSDSHSAFPAFFCFGQWASPLATKLHFDVPHYKLLLRSQGLIPRFIKCAMRHLVALFRRAGASASEATTGKSPSVRSGPACILGPHDVTSDTPRQEPHSRSASTTQACRPSRTTQAIVSTAQLTPSPPPMPNRLRSAYMQHLILTMAECQISQSCFPISLAATFSFIHGQIDFLRIVYTALCKDSPPCTALERH